MYIGTDKKKTNVLSR